MAKFYRLIPSAPRIDCAERRANGWLPERAVKWCDAATLASAWGFYAYMPLAISVVRLDDALFWRYGKQDAWLPLGAAQFPHFSEKFDAAAPAALRGCAPPFLSALEEPGLLQIWTGYFVRSLPGCSLLVRPPANIPPHGAYRMFEGIIEADRYFAPLFTNIEIAQPKRPVHFGMNKPLIQISSLPREVYKRRGFDAVDAMAQFSAQDWADYQATVARRERAATYAIAARRRRKREEAP